MSNKPGVQKGGSKRTWMFTINNYSETTLKGMAELGNKKTEVSYMVVGKEVGSKKGTPHLQGCVTFKKPRRFNNVVSVFSELVGPGEAANLTFAKNCTQARLYCQKDGDFTIYDNGKQGKRSDLEPLIESVQAGNTLRYVAREFPKQFIKYHGGIGKLTQFYQAKRSKPPIVTWIYGPTGTGKSRRVAEITAGEEVWESGSRSDFYNGYECQKHALFDDFRGSFCKFSWLLRLLDRYPVSVNVKGGHCPWNSEYIWITSSKAPQDAYNACQIEENLNQLTRRLTNIIELRELGEPGIVHKGVDSNFFGDSTRSDE